MGDGQHARLEQLFNAALQKGSSSERAAFLDDACGDDPLLRRSVQALLTAHEEAETFLSTPAVDAQGAALGGSEREAPGTRIGHYKILQQIGEGGFGAVYMAEQEQPVRRKVALKIIKLGMDTKQVIARFEAERQALALMDHSNIAKVLDAGATETGRPYFVMELVRGVAITEYCDKNRLSTVPRLELFMQVCRAVQHAHQKGVIHRDIKPNNVLVTLHDSRPVPKVIDFGIAKATSQRLTEKTLFTEFRQFIGTPEYMSPDQAEISGLDVDTRTDIYSLGVLLYELLTGTTPFDAATLRKASYAEIQRIIREVDPPIPSTRASTLLERGAEIAVRRQVEPAALSKLIRGDLDWIVMKALEKDRTRRYETAAEFANDVQRHLNHEPVAASPPSTTYKLRKFVRRNQAAVLAGALVAAALVAGLSLATVGFIQATQAQAELQGERDAAEAARADAEAARVAEHEQRERAERSAAEALIEASKAAAVSSYLEQMLASLDPRRAMGREVTIRSVLDRAAAQIDEGALTEQPAVEAGVRMTIGKTYEALGFYAPAEEQIRAAERLRRRVLGEDHADTLRSQSALAELLSRQRKHAESEALFRQTIAAQRRVLGAEHADTLVSLTGLGAALERQGRNQEAEQIHRDTLARQRRVLGPEHIDTLRSMVSLGTTLLGQSRLAESEAVLREALESGRRVLGREHPDVVSAVNNLALTLERQGKLPQAEALYREALESDRRVLGADHPTTQIPLHNLLRVLRLQDNMDATRPLVADLLDRRKRAADRPNADAATLDAYARLLLTCEPSDLRDPVEGLAVAERAVRKDRGKDAGTLETLALAYARIGDVERAIETQQRALERAVRDPRVSASEVEHRLIGLMWEHGDWLGAGRVVSRMVAERVARAPVAGLDQGASLALQARVRFEQGNYAEAEALLRSCLRMRRRALPAGHWLVAETRSLLGAALAGQGKFAEAEPLLHEGYAGLRDHAEAPVERRHAALDRIVALYEDWGQPERAAEWRDRSTASGDEAPSSE